MNNDQQPSPFTAYGNLWRLMMLAHMPMAAPDPEKAAPDLTDAVLIRLVDGWLVVQEGMRAPVGFQLRLTQDEIQRLCDDE